MQIKLVTAAIVAILFFGMVAYIFKLRADCAEFKAEVGRQEELVRNREARIKGLETVVARKETEIAAVSSQVEAIRDAMGTMASSAAAVEGIFANASDAPPKNKGDVSDEGTSYKALRYLNDLRGAFASPVVRREAAGNQDSGRSKNQPLPEAVP